VDCVRCEDGRFNCPPSCDFIAPGSLGDQAYHELLEPEDVSDVDGRL
jgi:hypothetical protein